MATYKITLTKTIAKNGKPYFYAQSTKRNGKKTRITKNRFYYLHAMSEQQGEIKEINNSYIVECSYTWCDFMFLTYGN